MPENAAAHNAYVEYADMNARYGYQGGEYAAFTSGYRAGRAAALKEAATRRRDASRLSDFGADAQTAEERRILSERWEREHPGVDSSASRLRPRVEGKDQ